MTTTLPARPVRQRTRAGILVTRPSRTPVLLELAGHAASTRNSITAAVRAAWETLGTPDAAGARAVYAATVGYAGDPAGLYAAAARSIGYTGTDAPLFAAACLSASSASAVAASLYRAAREAMA